MDEKSFTVGFECDFFDPPPEVLQTECPVCLQIIREPQQVTCCGKKFCQSCLQTIKDRNKPCPLCKAKNYTSFTDKGFRQSLYGLKVRCSHQREGCEWTGELRQLDEHLNTDPQPENQLEGCPLTTIHCDFHHVGCTVKLPRRDMSEHLKENLNLHLSRLARSYGSLKQEFDKIKDENESLKKKVSSLQSSSHKTKPRRMIAISPSNALVMSNFERYKRDGGWWYSPSIYTHPNGYKLCLGVCAGGYGNSTHVSVFVYLMRGEYDDELTWPFRGTITFQLLNVTGDNHKSHLCVYDDGVEAKNCETTKWLLNVSYKCIHTRLKNIKNIGRPNSLATRIILKKQL